MYVEIGTEAAQFPEKENINEIFLAVHTGQLFLERHGKRETDIERHGKIIGETREVSE